jgi:hypothetical protein
MQALSIDDHSLAGLDIKTLRGELKDRYSKFGEIQTTDGKTVKFTQKGFREIKSHSAACAPH